MANERKFKGIAKDFISAMKLQFIGRGADPNDIFVQDLYNHEANNHSSVQTVNDYTKLNVTDRKILDCVLKVFNEHITNKRELLNQSRQLFETDVVQNIIDVMIDDGFNAFNNEEEEFRIIYDLSEEDKDTLGEDFQKQIQNEIDEFVEKFSVKSKVAEMLPELLRDGEYAYGVLFNEEEKKGVTEIVDDMDVANLLPFYEGDKLTFVVKQDCFNDSGTNNNKYKYINDLQNKPVIYSPDNIVFFRLKGQTKKRINLSTFYNNEFRQEFYERTHIRLPKYIRIPVPIYNSAIQNINRLQVMMNVYTVLQLSDVLKPEVVSVTVPANTSPTDANRIIQDYERRLNDNSNLGEAQTLDFSTMAASANYRKVVPQWMDTKGTLQSTGIGTTSADKSASAWESVKNVGNLIALSVGIPPYYINMVDTPQDKAQTIKLFSRYTRKLTSLQKSVAEGVKDLIMLHLTKKGINISRNNLVIKFKAITSGDSLDDTDMMVATVTGINDLYKGIEEITSSDNNNLVIDDQQFKELFDNLTSRYLNISNLIKISDTKFEEEEFSDEEGFEPSEGPSGGGGSRERLSQEGADIDSEFRSAGIDADNESAYDDFANASDNFELESNQEIETEI